MMTVLVRILDSRSEIRKCVGLTEVNAPFSKVYIMACRYNSHTHPIVDVGGINTVCGISLEEIKRFNKFLFEKKFGDVDESSAELYPCYSVNLNPAMMDTVKPYELDFH